MYGGISAAKMFFSSQYVFIIIDFCIYIKLLYRIHGYVYPIYRGMYGGHYGENPSNHELLTVRGGDCRASKKMFGSLLPP